MVFNNDLTRMICIIDELKVNVYKGEISEDTIKWTVIRKIDDFPFYFMESNWDLDCNFLTPCFKYYLKYKSS